MTRRLFNIAAIVSPLLSWRERFGGEVKDVKVSPQYTCSENFVMPAKDYQMIVCRGNGETIYCTSFEEAIKVVGRSRGEWCTVMGTVNGNELQ